MMEKPGVKAEESVAREFIEAPRIIYAQAKAEGRLIEGRSLAELRELALRQNGVVQTQMGSIASDSEPASRCAPKTKNSIDDPFGEEEAKLARQASEMLGRQRIISMDAPVGEDGGGITARFLISERYAQLAYGLRLLFGELERKMVEEPTYTLVFFTDEAFEHNQALKDVRKKDVTIRLWMGARRGEQVKICRNSIYLGEGKKGVFQFEDWRVKAIDKEGLFLHAGVRRDHLWVYDYNLRGMRLAERVTAVSGLTATGKTATLCRRLARLPDETSEMIGDDGGTFGFDGSFCAFEKGGLYVKTEGLEEHRQPEIYKAATSRQAFLENVKLTIYPYIPDFGDLSSTSNGRAIVTRDNLGIASDSIRAEGIGYIIILTRNPLMNAIAKLTPEQATMQFIYGESIESSGGNPVEAGKFRREFFLDPFVCGDKLEHAMIFYEYLRKNPQIECYLANTGTIGEAETKVTLRDSLAAYNDLLRGQIKFSLVPDILGYHPPVQCDRANLDVLRMEPLFPDRKLLEEKIKDFLRGREAYLEEFEKGGDRIPAPIRESLRWR